MTASDTIVTPTLKAYARHSPSLVPKGEEPPPRRTAPFDQEPGFHEPAGLWLYGNARLLNGKLSYIEQVLGPPDQAPDELDEIERLAEQLVLDGKVLVSGVHNAAHQRAAIVPLRWGAPRILIMSGGFHYHLGQDLKDEPFRAARLWRFSWDPKTDLAISRRAPTKLPTFAHHNPTVDRLIKKISECNVPGLRWMDGDTIRTLA